MKRDQEKLKEEFLTEAEELFDRLMEWEGEHDRPNLTQIEDIILELRKRFGEELAEKVLKSVMDPKNWTPKKVGIRL